MCAGPCAVTPAGVRGAGLVPGGGGQARSTTKRQGPAQLDVGALKSQQSAPSAGERLAPWGSSPQQGQVQVQMEIELAVQYRHATTSSSSPHSAVLQATAAQGMHACAPGRARRGGTSGSHPHPPASPAGGKPPGAARRRPCRPAPAASAPQTAGARRWLPPAQAGGRAAEAASKLRLIRPLRGTAANCPGPGLPTSEISLPVPPACMYCLHLSRSQPALLVGSPRV